MADTIKWFIQDYWVYFFLLAGTLVFSGPRHVLMAISHALLKTSGIRSNYIANSGKLEVDHDDFSKGEVEKIKYIATNATKDIGRYQAHSKVSVKPLSKADKKLRKQNKQKNNEEL